MSSLGAAWVALAKCLDFGPFGSVEYLFWMQHRHRVNLPMHNDSNNFDDSKPAKSTLFFNAYLDVVADDELHSGQADPITGHLADLRFIAR